MKKTKTQKRHKHFFSIFKIRFFLLVLYTTFIFITFANAQELRPKPKPSFRCVIWVDHEHWKKNQPAIIRGYIVNLTDQDLKICLATNLFLAPSKEKDKLKNSFYSPVDLLTNETLDINGKTAMIISKRRKIDFVLDANKLKWAKTISSVWPVESLFNAVNKGVYYLSVGFGKIESNSVRVVLE
jgi:hypothetical protein